MALDGLASVRELPPCDPTTVPLQFSIKCKNTGRDHRYDFTALASVRPDIVRAFVAALYARRDAVGHLARSGYKQALKRFMAYLDA